MRVNGKDGELRRSQGKGSLEGGGAEEDAETSFEVERLAGLVAATVLQTLRQVQHSGDHRHRVCRGGVHMTGDQLEGERARRTFARLMSGAGGGGGGSGGGCKGLERR